MTVLTFKLDSYRVNQLEAAGVRSIRDLYQVLSALDLKATIELDPDHHELPSRKTTPSTTSSG